MMKTTARNYTFAYNGILTEEQHIFFEKYGFLHFKSLLNSNGVDACLQEIKQVEKYLIINEIEQINGTTNQIRIKGNQKIFSQINFLSLFSKRLQGFLRTPFFYEIKKLMGEASNIRIGENEWKGLVYKNVSKTEAFSLKELNETQQPATKSHLNICIFLDAVSNLKIYPSTHRADSVAHYFYKLPRLLNQSNERQLDIQAGDLLILHSDLYHHFETAQEKPQRLLYFPILSGQYKPKQDFQPLQMSNTMRSLYL